MSELTLFIPGIPKAQPRARATSRGGRFTRMYDPGTAEAWKGCIALAIRDHMPAAPMDGPVRVDLTFLLPRPKRLMRKRDPDGAMYCTAKPDRDNLDKAVLDCLTEMGMWRDDAQVVDGRLRKMYAPKDGRTGVELRITQLENE